MARKKKKKAKKTKKKAAKRPSRTKKRATKKASKKKTTRKKAQAKKTKKAKSKTAQKTKAKKTVKKARRPSNKPKPELPTSSVAPFLQSNPPSQNSEKTETGAQIGFPASPAPNRFKESFSDPNDAEEDSVISRAEGSAVPDEDEEYGADEDVVDIAELDEESYQTFPVDDVSNGDDDESEL